MAICFNSRIIPKTQRTPYWEIDISGRLAVGDELETEKSTYSHFSYCVSSKGVCATWKSQFPPCGSLEFLRLSELLRERV